MIVPHYGAIVSPFIPRRSKNQHGTVRPISVGCGPIRSSEIQRHLYSTLVVSVTEGTLPPHRYLKKNSHFIQPLVRASHSIADSDCTISHVVIELLWPPRAPAHCVVLATTTAWDGRRLERRLAAVGAAVGARVGAAWPQAPVSGSRICSHCRSRICSRCRSRSHYCRSGSGSDRARQPSSYTSSRGRGSSKTRRPTSFSPKRRRWRKVLR